MRSTTLAAALALAAAGEGLALSHETMRASALAGADRRVWLPKSPPRERGSTETPATFGQQVDKRRAKAKAASKARAQQRKRTKGKR